MVFCVIYGICSKILVCLCENEGLILPFILVVGIAQYWYQMVFLLYFNSL